MWPPGQALQTQTLWGVGVDVGARLHCPPPGCYGCAPSPQVSIGSTCGAMACAVTGRYMARECVEARLRHFPKFRAIDAALCREGWQPSV